MLNIGRFSVCCDEKSRKAVLYSDLRQTNNETAMDFMDDVKNALADGVRIGQLQPLSFTAVFSDMKITECMWNAYDGQ